MEFEGWPPDPKSCSGTRNDTQSLEVGLVLQVGLDLGTK